MICKKCQELLYCRAFSYGNCKLCLENIVTPHIPCYKICKECSEKFNICEQCGEPMEEHINKDTHVYCTMCIYGDILLNSIISNIEIPHCCQGCDYWNPEDSVRLENRPNYSPKI